MGRISIGHRAESQRADDGGQTTDNNFGFRRANIEPLHWNYDLGKWQY